MSNFNTKDGITLVSSNRELALAVDGVVSKIYRLSVGECLKPLLKQLRFKGISATIAESPMGLWGLYIKDRNADTGEFLLGMGFTPGVISGLKPTSEWWRYYRLVGIKPETVELFVGCHEISHYGLMVDFLVGLNTLQLVNKLEE